MGWLSVRLLGDFLYHSVFYLSLSFNWIRSSFPLWERLIGQWTVTAEQNQKGLNINRTSFFWSKSYIILIFIDTEFNLYLLNSFKLTYLDNSIDILNEKYSTIAIWCNSLLINVGVFSILFFSVYLNKNMNYISILCNISSSITYRNKNKKNKENTCHTLKSVMTK